MKKLGQVSYLESGKFPKIFCDYVDGRKELKGFYDHRPNAKNVAKKIKEREKFSIDRELLVNRLNFQYQGLEVKKAVKKNIESLKLENSFTITTGHQLNLLSGPLFFHYKIQTVIKVCEDLKKKYSNHNFVPVFWMASEDHDFEEIDHCMIGNKKVQWSSKQQGAVGRFQTQGLDKVLKGIPEGGPELQKHYVGKSLSEATRKLVDHWYGDQGLIILDSDDAELKTLFISTMEKELEESFVQASIEETTEQLQDHHYGAQVNPREINLFYLTDKARSRIVKNKAGFSEHEGKKSWSRKEILNELKEKPGNFSPNVVMRPLYQELILPNLAYVGGPAEIAYWLQLRKQFKEAEISFPLLLPRISVCILNDKFNSWWKELGLHFTDLFGDKREVELKWIGHFKGEAYSLVEEFQKLEKMEGHLLKQARDIDRSLIKYVGARTREMEKDLERISKKFRKALERKEKEKLERIDRVLEHCFPSGSMQERYWNFLTLFPPDLGDLKKMSGILDPWEFTINIVKV